MALDRLAVREISARYLSQDERIEIADLRRAGVSVRGAGADALATCEVIEEVARVCASSSLFPAVNKLGNLPLILAGSEEIKATYLPPLARGDAAFSYGLSEREA
jgi:alkylation response protein AidB-like acyl-CoA dehydrogenase